MVVRTDHLKELQRIDAMTNNRSRVSSLKDLAAQLVTIFPETGDYLFGPFVLPRGLIHVQYQGLTLMGFMVGVMEGEGVKFERIIEDCNKMMSPFVMEV